MLYDKPRVLNNATRDAVVLINKRFEHSKNVELCTQEHAQMYTTVYE